MIKSINVTKKNYLDYSNFAIKRLSDPNNKKSAGLLKNIIVWCVLTVAIMTVFQMKPISFANFHWPSALATAFPFVVAAIAFFINVQKFKRLAIPKNNGLMLGNRTIEFNREGLTDTNELGVSFYKWRAVEDVVENEGNIYIFVDNLLAQIIPAESFNTEQERVELIQLVKANMSNDATNS